MCHSKSWQVFSILATLCHQVDHYRAFLSEAGDESRLRNQGLPQSILENAFETDDGRISCQLAQDEYGTI